jgi:hypothetical protein
VQRALRRLASSAPLIVATATLAGVCTWAVLRRTGGEPAVPLDDAFIHFQYARSFAHLEPLAYTRGAEPTAGATSLLWPLVLSPFVAAGVDGSSLVWVAWLFGWVSLGLLVHETYRAALGLVSFEGALAAAVMVLAFGAYAWCAASGMEVVPFAWLLMRGARRAAEWAEGAAVPRVELCALGWLAPLMRPEGAIVSLLAVAVLASAPRGASRAWAACPLAGPLLPALANWMFTGRLESTTAVVKWLPLNPYYTGARLWGAILDNLALLFGTLFDGELWSASVLPHGGALVAWLVLPAIALAGRRQNRAWRAAAVGCVAIGMLFTTSYDSFLWNRLRYLWPFAAAWFIGLAAVADAFGALCARLRPELGGARILAAGFFVGALAGHMSFAIDDLSVSADAIRRQQVALGRWAKQALSRDARIGVNDTGAIAYFSDRRVFDIVGLTTRGEARYWTAGAGARFEHYERLGAQRLPTHFIVYPDWIGIPELLGERLTERTVVNATILGGTTMGAYVADYSLLGSGERPTNTPAAALLDRLDVADLESEAEHAYELFDASQAECVVLSDASGLRLDGARSARSAEAFELRLSPGGKLVARFSVRAPVVLDVRASGRSLGRVALSADGWQEVALALPADLPGRRQRIEVQSSPKQQFAALQYWSFGPAALEASKAALDTR